MPKEVSEIIKNFIKSHFILTLATLNGDEIDVCNLFYVTEDGQNLYFTSKNSSAHCKNILKISTVSGTMYKHNKVKDYEDDKIGVQFKASASKITDRTEALKGLFLYGLKFVGAKDWHTDFDETLKPDAKWSLYKIKITKVKMLNSKLSIKQEDYIDL